MLFYLPCKIQAWYSPEIIEYYLHQKVVSFQVWPSPLKNRALSLNLSWGTFPKNDSPFTHSIYLRRQEVFVWHCLPQRSEVRLIYARENWRQLATPFLEAGCPAVVIARLARRQFRNSLPDKYSLPINRHTRWHAVWRNFVIRNSAIYMY